MLPRKTANIARVAVLKNDYHLLSHGSSALLDILDLSQIRYERVATNSRKRVRLFEPRDVQFCYPTHTSRGDSHYNILSRGISQMTLASLSPAMFQIILPDETLIDGEVLVLDQAGKPFFSLLQNIGSSRQQVHFYVFDLLVLLANR